MTMSTYERFARLLDYPASSLTAEVDGCIAALSESSPAAAEHLRAFRAALADTSVARLEETYTATFDLRAASCLYVGHHLFAEPWRRALFMGRLRELYRTCGVPEDKELPDHLCSMLRFLAAHAQSDEGRDLIEECILPAIGKLAPRLSRTSPYGMLIEALSQWLSCELRQAASTGSQALAVSRQSDRGGKRLAGDPETVSASDTQGVSSR
jgi:nitrate reductase molybdenum cofactor assembly chaperone NarJ/NarW